MVKRQLDGVIRAGVVTAGAYCAWWFLAHGRVGHPQLKRLQNHRYAHRGLHTNPAVPENSLPAFHRAVERGYGAELDVHLTRDGRLAVVHDSDLGRLTGRAGTVEELTAVELGQRRLLGTDERIPFLEEVLPLFEGRTPLIVEIKPVGGNQAKLTAATMRCLDQFDLTYCVESFDPRVLLWLRTHRPEVVRGQLTQNFLKRGDGGGQPWPLRLFLTALLGDVAARPDFIAERFSDRRNWAHRLCCGVWGVQGVYWTIDSPRDQAVAEGEDHLVIFEGYEPSES